MILSTEETLKADGMPLNTLAWNIRTFEGRLNMPALKGEAISPPGRSGSIPAENRPYEAQRLGYGMWVLGCTTDGLIPDDSSMRREFDKNRRVLNILFGRGRLIHLEQTLPDLSIEECWVSVADRLDLSTMAGGTRAEFNTLLDNHDVFWQGQDIQVTAPGTISIPATIPVTELEGSTAPIEDATYEITGPLNAANLTDEISGHVCMLLPNIPAAQKWIIDSRLSTSTLNGVNAIGDTVHLGGPRLMRMVPKLGVDVQSGEPAAEAPVVTLSGTGATSATRIVIRARRKFF